MDGAALERIVKILAMRGGAIDEGGAVVRPCPIAVQGPSSSEPASALLT
jgi:hypothetical protein